MISSASRPQNSYHARQMGIRPPKKSLEDFQLNLSFTIRKKLTFIKISTSNLANCYRLSIQYILHCSSNHWNTLMFGRILLVFFTVWAAYSSAYFKGLLKVIPETMESSWSCCLLDRVVVCLLLIKENFKSSDLKETRSVLRSKSGIQKSEIMRNFLSRYQL